LRYVSTRGQAEAAGFSDVLLAGLAPDGGLYVPEEWPAFSREEIAAFAGRPYAEVAAAVMGRYVGDALAADQLLAICQDAYATFAHPAVAPVKQLGSGRFLLELFHGPTLAFKDVAMQLIARLYEAVLAAEERVLTVVCATSGDTGGAAVEAFRGARHARIVVLFPHERISEVQRRFMTTTTDANVRVVAVDGHFDDCQRLVKALFQDEAFRTSVDLSGVNSINWARVAAQSVYYFTSAVALGAPDRPVGFTVPTGNFGDGFAGYAARRMGLDVAGLTVATNSNDILARALATGVYRSDTVTATQSPAMDIQVASNFERLYFEASRRDGRETARAFAAFAAEGCIELPPQTLAYMRSGFSAEAVREEETARTILSVLNETGELIDPHTAVGVAAARRATASPTLQVVLATAHPAKFPDAVRAATGSDPALHARARGLMERPERIDRLPADTSALKAYIRRFALG
jgi:threonine synthase